MSTGVKEGFLGCFGITFTSSKLFKMISVCSLAVKKISLRAAGRLFILIYYFFLKKMKKNLIDFYISKSLRFTWWEAAETYSVLLKNGAIILAERSTVPCLLPVNSCIRISSSAGNGTPTTNK